MAPARARCVDASPPPRGGRGCARTGVDRGLRDTAQSVEIIAGGRGDWIGWLELAAETINEIGVRMTARVIADLDADIIATIEAEDWPSPVRLNPDLLAGRYRHVMLVDGNDERGIDVGLAACSSRTGRWCRATTSTGSTSVTGAAPSMRAGSATGSTTFCSPAACGRPMSLDWCSAEAFGESAAHARTGGRLTPR
jgi:hypothetical protein